MNNETQALEVLPPSVPTPKENVQLAGTVATLCREIVLKTSLTIQGRKYVRVEGWQAIATAHGCAAGSRDVKRIEGGYSALGEVRRISDGVLLATAEGFVGDDEVKTWANRPEYARRAMAQTRAISRVCRAVFAHVVVMMDAGLSTTPAEEVPEGGFYDLPSQDKPKTVKTSPAASSARQTALSGADAAWENWLEKLKARALTLFKPHEFSAWCYGIEMGWILDTERLDDARASKMFSILDPTRGIQGNGERVKALVDGWLATITGTTPDPELEAKYAEVYINADQIPGAEVPGGLEGEIEVKGTLQRVTPGVGVPGPVSKSSGTGNEATGDLSWRNYLMHIPPKGVKKADYDPVSLGALWDLAESGDDDSADAARKRLFGQAKFFEPKPWTNKFGKTVLPSEEDKALRRGLDLFNVWHEAKKIREKAVRAND